MAAPTVSAPKPAEDQERASVLSVLVVGPGFTSTLVLPAAGAVVVGRAEDADLRIVDQLASRRHACLHIGSTIEIEDLGSGNGTRVREQLLPPGERRILGAGEAVSIGSTLLVIQRREAVAPSRVVWPHGYFEARLIEEIARAESGRSELGLARVSLALGSSAARAAEIFKAELRPGDVVGDYGPDEFEVLLPDSEGRSAAQVVERVARAFRAAGVATQTGIAHFPADATSPGALLSAASARLRRAASDGQPSPLSRLSQVSQMSWARAGTVVVNPAMRALYELAERVAASAINVLILGETGSGKEVIAETIHRLSPRAGGPLVSINCAALSETLLESELFGHEKGAFSGATGAKAGLLETAAGGSLFLDEVGEMSALLQAKLLRALESRKAMRVGGTSPRALDVRFIAATNRVLEEEVARGAFRSDLYFRLSGITLEVPPLRERTDEIVPLARLFLENAAAQMSRPVPALSLAAVALLEAYAWPGNVRELRNVMERALLFTRGSTVDAEHLPADKLVRGPGAGKPEGADDVRNFRLHQNELERTAIVDALARCGGNQTRAAEYLNMPRRTFCNRLTEYGIRTGRP